MVRGGRFVFATASEKLLLGLLPPLVHVTAGEAASERVRTLLAINEAESVQPGSGSEFIMARLMELLLAELLRSGALTMQPSQAGLLAGLADPVTARALATLHRDLAGPWTTASLARLCGSSRSGFSQRFTRVVGVPPMRCWQCWRMAVARDELRRGQYSIAEIARLVGFQSGSTFSTAFTRTEGCSPGRFTERAQRG